MGVRSSYDVKTNRESRVKKSILVAALMATSCVAVATVSVAQISRTKYTDFKDIYYPAGVQVQNAPEIPYDPVDTHFFKFPKSAKYGQDIDFGEVSAVTDDDQGNVYVLNRNNVEGNVYGGNATEVLEFDAKGNFVREIGDRAYGFAYGHGIRVHKGFLYVVDKGSDMVTKFNLKTGKQEMVLGRRAEAADAYWERNPGDRSKQAPEDGAFAQPTDIAFDSQDNMYVSDGYVHSRVAKFSPDGTYLGTWGTHGSGPGQFSTVHNIQIDKNDHVWVADRANARVQEFDTQGNFIKEIIIRVPTKTYTPDLGHEQPPAPCAAAPAGPCPTSMDRPGAPDALCYNSKENVMFLGDIYPGRVYKIDLDGKVLGYFGHVGRAPGNSGPIHGLACGNANVIYTAEFVNDRVERFVIHPEKAMVTGN
jgi:DNA-binding beta-propeller fold protein YncE